jgi:hypothetical protein
MRFWVIFLLEEERALRPDGWGTIRLKLLSDLSIGT